MGGACLLSSPEVIPHALRLSRLLRRLFPGRQSPPFSAAGRGLGNAERRVPGAEARRESCQLYRNSDEGVCQAESAESITDSASQNTPIHDIFGLSIWFASRCSVY